MTETILRDGEVAFTSNGDVIMNVNTLLELKAKLQKPAEQTNEQAMENVCVLLATLFGPDILDKKPAPKPTPAPVRDPKEDIHPKQFDPFFFPDKVLLDVNCNPSSVYAYEGSPFVYIDNYGNIFGTMGECDYRHQLPGGCTSKLLSGKQIVGYAEGYGGWMPDKVKNLKDFRDPSKYNMLLPTGIEDNLFSHKHLVNVVKVAKNDIFPNKDVPEKFRTDRQTRYNNYKAAVEQANTDLKAKLKKSYDRVMSGCTIWAFRKLIAQELGVKNWN